MVQTQPDMYIIIYVCVCLGKLQLIRGIIPIWP